MTRLAFQTGWNWRCLRFTIVFWRKQRQHQLRWQLRRGNGPKELFLLKHGHRFGGRVFCFGARWIAMIFAAPAARALTSIGFPNTLATALKGASSPRKGPCPP